MEEGDQISYLVKVRGLPLLGYTQNIPRGHRPTEEDVKITSMRIEPTSNTKVIEFEMYLDNRHANIASRKEGVLDVKENRSRK